MQEVGSVQLQMDSSWLANPRRSLQTLVFPPYQRSHKYVLQLPCLIPEGPERDCRGSCYLLGFGSRVLSNGKGNSCRKRGGEGSWHSGIEGTPNELAGDTKLRGAVDSLEGKDVIQRDRDRLEEPSARSCT